MGAMPGAVEEMASTPNSQNATDGSNMDKKRNKLGYHRTSVACGQYPLRSAALWLSFPPSFWVSLIARSNCGLAHTTLQCTVDEGKSGAW